MRQFLISIALFCSGMGVANAGNDSMARHAVMVPVSWVDKLPGDFSFRYQWHYPENVFRNTCGQLGCDGMCTEEIQKMLNKNGCIYTRYLPEFYRIIDTSHQYRSISCDAWCYEYGEALYVKAEKVEKDVVKCWTMCNAGTHCSLHLDFVKDSCLAYIVLRSVTTMPVTTFYVNRGYINVDREQWAKGILKAEFDLKFYDTFNPRGKFPVLWRGKIYKRISAGRQEEATGEQ